MGQNHPKFFLSHFIKLSHILANYTKGQVAKLIRTILKMSLELIYRIWITLYNPTEMGFCTFKNLLKNGKKLKTQILDTRFLTIIVISWKKILSLISCGKCLQKHQINIITFRKKWHWQFIGRLSPQRKR